jgi:hypothetical protein
MAGYSTRPRKDLRESRGHSNASDSPFTPAATPQPTRRAGVGTCGVHAETVDSELYAASNATAKVSDLPAHYTLPPTLPSPFNGTHEGTLDAILDFGVSHPGTQCVVNALLQTVSPKTNWPLLLRTVYLQPNTPQEGRVLLEEILFFTTRTLYPEQIAGNRSLTSRLYERKKQLAIRLILRYDMLREWKMDASGQHPVTVASLPPPATPAPSADIDMSGLQLGTRRPLLPNIIPTLIAAPNGGFTTHAVRERMKHHVTNLDSYLLLSDEEVAGWSDQTLLGIMAQVVLQWQWLRQNNEILTEMEVLGYEELEGKADECEWIADDLKVMKKKRGKTRDRDKDEDFVEKVDEKME